MAVDNVLPIRPRATQSNAVGHRPLLDDLNEFIRRYVIVTDEEHLILALWALHTYIYDSYPQTPYLAITSAEMRCGKSRVLQVLKYLVSRPWYTGIPSEAVLYRKISGERPTLLLDETDTIFNPKQQDRYEGHRAVLNLGFEDGAAVARMVGTSHVEEFAVYCPKALAGIGTLPATVADRSLPIRMVRKRKDQKVDRLLKRTAEPAGAEIRERVAEWLATEPELDDQPTMPEQLNDRMYEACEPIMALAEVFGVEESASAALVSILTSERLDSVDLMRHRLLMDLKTVWLDLERRHGKVHRSGSTESILLLLWNLPESPWADHYYGRRFSSVDLAAMLRPYGVSPKVLAKGKKRGYRRDDLFDVFERYGEGSE